jgi:hypothetical protein
VVACSRVLFAYHPPVRGEIGGPAFFRKRRGSPSEPTTIARRVSLNSQSAELVGNDWRSLRQVPVSGRRRGVKRAKDADSRG